MKELGCLLICLLAFFFVDIRDLDNLGFRLVWCVHHRYVSGSAGGVYRRNVQQAHPYCGFKVTKSCEDSATVIDNIDQDAIAKARQQKEIEEARAKEVGGCLPHS